MWNFFEMKSFINGSGWPAWVKMVLFIIAMMISAGIGGGISRHWGESKYEISYSDFISIMLTAISLLMTLVAILIAVLGILGWSSIENKVREKVDILFGELKPTLIELAKDATEKKADEMFNGVESVVEKNEDNIANKEPNKSDSEIKQ